MFFDEYFEFAKFVGLLTPIQTAALKLGDDGGGGFQPYQLPVLKKFIEENPEYHIVTETSDCDEFESGCGWTYDNHVRYVNRLRYFLANGSKEDSQLAEEDESDDLDDDLIAVEPDRTIPLADQ